MNVRELAYIRIFQHYQWKTVHTVDEGGGWWEVQKGSDVIRDFELEALFHRWLERSEVLLALCGVEEKKQEEAV
jgi:hypothetical protein